MPQRFGQHVQHGLHPLRIGAPQRPRRLFIDVAVGIGHDVSRVYTNATKIAKIDQLGPALTTKLIGLLTEGL